MTNIELKNAAKIIRKDLLKLSSIESIHIGGDLSCADIMTVLWQYKMKYNPKNPKDESRDRFVLSKSHASAVMSLNQAAIGCFDKQEVFEKYAKDESMFSMHSCSLLNPFVEVSTGSLGHGMPIACGMAKALKLKGNTTSRVYVLMGDGEQSEGSIWEAAANASTYKLGNLIAILDNNGISADGRLDEFGGVLDIRKKYEAFGWNVLEVSGNSIDDLIVTFDSIPEPTSSKPTIIIAHTTKGKGVPFMEDNPRWHAGKITEEQLEEGLLAIETENE